MRGPHSFLFALLLFLTASQLADGPPTETLLSSENGYNLIPSPDGKAIAYVRTGWGRQGGSGGFGRSNLISEIMVISENGDPVTAAPLTDAFLGGWTPDGNGLICFRDWNYSLVALNGKRSLQGKVSATERVFYLSKLGEVAWSRLDGRSNTVLETHDRIIAEHDGWLGDIVVPSPDGRYLAVFGEGQRKHLWVYDMQLSTWSDLDAIGIHPDNGWDYVKASWSPWFSDSLHLAYFSDSNELIISEPDGGSKKTFAIDRPAGLAAPSPDGGFVAYVTFDPRPRKLSPDLTFWGGTTIWVLTLDRGKAAAVTDKNSGTTYDLRWMGNDTLVFDRFEDQVFPNNAHIWKVPARRTPRLEITPTN